MKTIISWLCRTETHPLYCLEWLYTGHEACGSWLIVYQWETVAQISNHPWQPVLSTSYKAQWQAGYMRLAIHSSLRDFPKRMLDQQSQKSFRRILMSRKWDQVLSLNSWTSTQTWGVLFDVTLNTVNLPHPSLLPTVITCGNTCKAILKVKCDHLNSKTDFNRLPHAHSAIHVSLYVIAGCLSRV